MNKSSLLCTGFVALLGLNTSCGSSTDSGLKASLNQSLTQKWGTLMDVSKELSPNLADNLTASKSSVDSVEIGAKLGATFSFGSSVIFNVGGGMDYGDVFERKVLNEVKIGRAKDENGDGDGNGVFLDADTVAGNRFVNCKSQKVIADSSKFNVNVNSGISFMGLELGTRLGSGHKVETSTDYTMNRGFYRTREPVKLATIFELCADIAKSDVALQNIDHINSVVKMNFNKGEDLEKLASQVAAGKKVNNFQFHNIKYDFQKLRQENNRITFTIFPDTYYADPKLESTVSYHMDGQRAVIDEVAQNCVSNCQNYHDQDGGHGLHSYGDKATKEQSERYIKLISTIFAARILNSK